MGWAVVGGQKKGSGCVHFLKLLLSLVMPRSHDQAQIHVRGSVQGHEHKETREFGVTGVVVLPATCCSVVGELCMIPVTWNLLNLALWSRMWWAFVLFYFSFHAYLRRICDLRWLGQHSKHPLNQAFLVYDSLKSHPSSLTFYMLDRVNNWEISLKFPSTMEIS